MPMIAFRPLCLSWQKTTCSWPVESGSSVLVNTPIAAPVVTARPRGPHAGCALRRGGAEVSGHDDIPVGTGTQTRVADNLLADAPSFPDRGRFVGGSRRAVA